MPLDGRLRARKIFFVILDAYGILHLQCRSGNVAAEFWVEFARAPEKRLSGEAGACSEAVLTISAWATRMRWHRPIEIHPTQAEELMHTLARRLLPGLLLAASATAYAVTPWQEIDLVAAGLVNGDGKVVNEHGKVLTDAAGRDLVPDCAFGPASGGPYRFFYQQGDSDELVVFHSGGGACWENNTCGSAVLSKFVPTIRSTFFPEILASATSLDAAKGIFDSSNPDNPYAEASKIFIPYCTGDVGWGNLDTTYDSPQGFSLPPTYVVHHRGYANIRAVTEWLKRHLATQRPPRRVLVAGTSAGGYAAIGSLLPEVAKLVPSRHTELSLIGDSANGVVTDNFLTGAARSWGFYGTLPSHIRSAVKGGAQALGARVYLSSIREYPDARFGQYQNAFDLVQTQFFNIMQNVNVPTLWNDPATIQAALANWTVQMRVNTLATAVSPAYRFYTAAGYEHGVLELVRASDGLGFCSDNFATETSGASPGGPLPLSEWAGAMSDGHGNRWHTGDWRNATCWPNCNVPPVCSGH
jgi:hypothetical protein